MADETPDYVNDVPEWYGPEWPEERRCQYEFELYRRLKERRLCGYPTPEDQPKCVFHSEEERDWAAVKEEMRRAVAAGICLDEAELRGAVLYGAIVSGAKLARARLAGSSLILADLSGAELGAADLTGAQLHGADLSRALLQCAKLVGAHLSGATLAGASMHSADLSKADLTLTKFPGDVGLSEAVLTDARLCGAEFAPEVDFDRVVWWEDSRRWWERTLQLREPMFRDEGELTDEPPADMEKRADWSKTLARCERTYRQIKRAYQNSGHYEEAGQFFIREMECKRKQSSGPRRAAFWLMHLLSDYFESPGRVLGIALSLVLAFAYLHGCLGLCDCPGPHHSSPPQWPTYATWDGLAYFVTTCVYFSMVTFTTLGYGDIHSANGWGRMACSVEAAMGATMLALFLVCLARKYGRA